MNLFDRLLRPLRIGVVTSDYPAAPPLLQPATRQLPRLDPAACTRDAACVSVCPTGAITLAADAWIVDAGRCIFCAACARACPTSAISMDGGVMLAAATAEGLLHVQPLRPAAKR
jgi:formate hydrogenlyase subunit 6/NADH:ubiquinone oxidoreductase subunit I